MFWIYRSDIDPGINIDTYVVIDDIDIIIMRVYTGDTDNRRTKAPNLLEHIEFPLS